MKFRDDPAWIMAMAELQGEISDPSPFRPDEYDETTAPGVRGAGRGDASDVVINAASAAPANGTVVSGAARTGQGNASKSADIP